MDIPAWYTILIAAIAGSVFIVAGVKLADLIYVKSESQFLAEEGL